MSTRGGAFSLKSTAKKYRLKQCPFENCMFNLAFPPDNIEVPESLKLQLEHCKIWFKSTHVKWWLKSPHKEDERPSIATNTPTNTRHLHWLYVRRYNKQTESTRKHYETQVKDKCAKSNDRISIQQSSYEKKHKPKHINKHSLYDDCYNYTKQHNLRRHDKVFKFGSPQEEPFVFNTSHLDSFPKLLQCKQEISKCAALETDSCHGKSWMLEEKLPTNAFQKMFQDIKSSFLSINKLHHQNEIKNLEQTRKELLFFESKENCRVVQYLRTLHTGLIDSKMKKYGQYDSHRRCLDYLENTGDKTKNKTMKRRKKEICLIRQELKFILAKFEQKTNKHYKKGKNNAFLLERKKLSQEIEKTKRELEQCSRALSPTRYQNNGSIVSDGSGRSVGWNAYFEGRDVDARVPKKYIENSSTFAVLLHFNSLLPHCKLSQSAFKQWNIKLHWMPFEVYFYLCHKFVGGFEDIQCTGYQRSLLIDMYILRKTIQQLVKKDEMLKSLDKIEKADILGYSKVTGHSTAIALCMPFSIPQFLVLLHLLILRLKVGYTTFFYSCIKDACRDLPGTFRTFWERVCPVLKQYLSEDEQKAIQREKEKEIKNNAYWLNETSFDQLPIAKALLAHAEQADRLTHLIEQNYHQQFDQRFKENWKEIESVQKYLIFIEDSCLSFRLQLSNKLMDIVQETLIAIASFQMFVMYDIVYYRLNLQKPTCDHAEKTKMAILSLAEYVQKKAAKVKLKLSDIISKRNKGLVVNDEVKTCPMLKYDEVKTFFYATNDLELYQVYQVGRKEVFTTLCTDIVNCSQEGSYALRQPFRCCSLVIAADYIIRNQHNLFQFTFFSTPAGGISGEDTENSDPLNFKDDLKLFLNDLAKTPEGVREFMMETNRFLKEFRQSPEEIDKSSSEIAQFLKEESTQSQEETDQISTKKEQCQEEKIYRRTAEETPKHLPKLNQSIQDVVCDLRPKRRTKTTKKIQQTPKAINPSSEEIIQSPKEVLVNPTTCEQQVEKNKSDNKSDNDTMVARDMKTKAKTAAECPNEYIALQAAQGQKYNLKAEYRQQQNAFNNRKEKKKKRPNDKQTTEAQTNAEGVGIEPQNLVGMGPIPNHPEGNHRGYRKKKK